MKNSNLLLMLMLAIGIATSANAMHDPSAELHHAIEIGDFHSVKELLANGADPLCEYNLRPEWPLELYKKTALALANDKRFAAIYEWHNNYGHHGLYPAEKKEKAEAIYNALLEKIVI